ncbi:MAG: outer membrane lipoprotein carrier protein LolA [Gammaproteobacteria bacterium]|nr:MAG: outer membrane lipoprotein carrier protein LolA [Gammaproteobacteria bacterium]
MLNKVFIRRRLLAFALMFGVIPAAGADAGDLLRQFFTSAVTLHASFRQQVEDEEGKLLEQSDGEMWIKRPGKFRWDYRHPGQQQIISNGEKVWIYDQDLEQVTVKQLNSALSDAPAMLLAGKGHVDERFHIRPLGARDGMDWLELTPKQDSAEFTRIEIGFKSGGIRSLQLTDQFGQTTRITFENNDINSKLSDDLFAFSVPENVDVFEVSD